ncbi:phage virion morphogenesis protein [Shewanella avicenniae]|uniref:Phage virion morphogenesis protein n=1 Tax=Shewanella avicenniae TaxID=2814294 RepID=A0ABX7QLY7_9GAMM|nr:phage virion morphogenesis protein [Shewanella avicenniae]QSX32459.1 phage virion morphogenesis protein [Shewanella avicenniae]
MATGTDNNSVIEVEFKAIQKTLKKIQHTPLDDFYRDVANRLKNNFLMGFKNSQAPDGTPWAPIRHREGKPLIDSGRLRRSIQAKHTGEQAEVGTNVVYARAQQEGLPSPINVKEHTRVINQAFGKKLKQPKKITVSAHKKKINIKPRPFFGLEAPQKKIIAQAFTHFMKKNTIGGQSVT